MLKNCFAFLFMIGTCCSNGVLPRTIIDELPHGYVVTPQENEFYEHFLDIVRNVQARHESFILTMGHLGVLPEESTGEWFRELLFQDLSERAVPSGYVGMLSIICHVLLWQDVPLEIKHLMPLAERAVLEGEGSRLSVLRYIRAKEDQIVRNRRGLPNSVAMLRVIRLAVHAAAVIASNAQPSAAKHKHS